MTAQTVPAELLEKDHQTGIGHPNPIDGCPLCSTVTDINVDVGGDAERGLAALSAKKRSLHPRAQVQTLRRSAQTLMRRAFYDGADRHALMMRAKDAVAAMQKLSRDHQLGY